MRTLPLIATIVLLFGNGSALGVEVDRQIEAPVFQLKYGRLQETSARQGLASTCGRLQANE